MIYLFHGSDIQGVRAKAFQWVAAVRAKEPNAFYLRLDAGSITSAALADAVSAQGLFYAKTLVLLDDPFSESGAGELVLERLQELAASENPIAILAPKLLAVRAKKLEAVATKVFTVDEKQKKPVRGFNSALVNALAARDARALWLELQKAQRQGDAPELLHGLLHWKARDLMQKGGRGWTPAQSRALSRELIELLSDSRSGALPLSQALERFALSL